MNVTNPIRTMYAALAAAHAGHESGEAFTAVCDMIDMGCLSPEVLLEVVIGQTTISEALLDAADVADDAGVEMDMSEEADEIASACRKAAATIKGLHSACPSH
jgi:hypothetical protein